MRVTRYASPDATARVRDARPRSTSATAADPALLPVDRVDHGDWLGIPEAERTDNVRRAIGELMQEVHDLHARLERAERRVAELEDLADRDPLLPIANRRAFVRELARARAFAERHGVPSTLVFLDINGMKRINDVHGHLAGDRALALVADVLGENTRFTDTVGRLGGDEFGVILSHTDLELGTTKAAQLVEAIAARPLEVDGSTMHLSVAHGVAPVLATGDADGSLAEADRAMYQRKQDMKAARAG